MIKKFNIILFVVALAIGLFVGGQFLNFGGETSGLSGSQKIIDNTLSYNRYLNEFPEIYWEFIEGNGFVVTDPLVVVQWPKKDTAFEDTPSDLLILLEFDKLPFDVKLSDKEVCEFKDKPGFEPICFFPPEGMNYAVWPEDWPDTEWWYHPGMPADNPEHTGVGHPALLILKKNLKGPVEYPADFEAKYPGLKLSPLSL